MLNKNKLRIAISGKSGCGNTTVSRILAERLGLRFINYTFRSLAEEDGVSFQEICRLAEESDDYDRRVDKKQLLLAREAPCVLGSRLALWLLVEADLKIFLNASLETRSQRIQQREGGEISALLEETQTRDRRDHDRYQRLYNIDTSNYEMADLIINTNRLEAPQVAAAIEAAALML